MTDHQISQLMIGIKGAGEMASGIACALYSAKMRNVFMMETATPLAVRREVAFCEAVHDRRQIIEGIEAVRVATPQSACATLQAGRLPVVVDPAWRSIDQLHPHVVIDAIIAKKNLGTRRGEAELVIALGPGFEAGVDADLVIETHRGHDLGRIIRTGFAIPNTGVPGTIGGQSAKRVIRAPATGRLETGHHIGDRVCAGDRIGSVGGKDIVVQLDGILRGLIRPATNVSEGLKIGDIDPRGKKEYCARISDKARSIGGAVLTAILSEFNTCSPICSLPNSACAMAG